MGARYGNIPDTEVVEKASIPEPNTGCWLWLGTLDRDGYGQINRRRKTVKAHRFSFSAFGGTLSDGLVLDHICRVRCCVNPDHLREVTPRDNVMNNSAGLGATNSAKTKCSGCGNPFTHVRAGRRECRPCSNVRQNTYRRNKRRGIRQ